MIRQRQRREARGKDSRGRGAPEGRRRALPGGGDGNAPRAPRHLPGTGAGRAAEDHLLKPARVSGGRAGALGCSAAEPRAPSPDNGHGGDPDADPRPPAAAGPATAPAQLAAAGPAAHAPSERACAEGGEAEEGALPRLARGRGGGRRRGAERPGQRWDLPWVEIRAVPGVRST